jgi:hypothetical protein
VKLLLETYFTDIPSETYKWVWFTPDFCKIRNYVI